MDQISNARESYSNEISRLIGTVGGRLHNRYPVHCVIYVNYINRADTSKRLMPTYYTARQKKRQFLLGPLPISSSKGNLESIGLPLDQGTCSKFAQMLAEAASYVTVFRSPHLTRSRLCQRVWVSATTPPLPYRDPILGNMNWPLTSRYKESC